MNTEYQPCYAADNHTNVAVFVSIYKNTKFYIKETTNGKHW